MIDLNAFRRLWIAAHGGTGILNDGDVEELNKGIIEALVILADGQWHTGIEIKHRHSQGMGEALRRVRDLRPWLKPRGFEVESKRTQENKRLFQYRIKPLTAEGEQIALPLQ
jgi:hypothetical protein